MLIILISVTTVKRNIFTTFQFIFLLSSLTTYFLCLKTFENEAWWLWFLITNTTGGQKKKRIKEFKNCFCFPTFFCLVSYSIKSLIRYPCWNKHPHTSSSVSGTDQIYSTQCIPCHVLVTFVFLHACLWLSPFLITPFSHWKRSLTRCSWKSTNFPSTYSYTCSTELCSFLNRNLFKSDCHIL